MATKEKFINQGVQNIAKSNSVINTPTDEKLEECSTKDVNETINCKGSTHVIRNRIKQQYCLIPSSTSTDVVVQKNYATKCNPNYFHMGVKDLTSRQIEDVKDSGFGGLLMTKLKTLPLGIVPWLVQNFNPHNIIQSLGNGNMYYITPDDVHDILGIPIYPGKKIEAVTHHGKGQTKDPSLVKKWMDVLKASKEEDLTLDKVVNAFSEHGNGGDVFKCLFILFSVSSFLSPNSERKVDKSLFKVLEDVSQLDWIGAPLFWIDYVHQ
ncbi:uncharacterized protein LOC141588812 [Silene latifolia]|uniref:uncharacterized protein LOC141588812 n=1 Tax=Silene latifolia TaxID=37657 RepID=UPI003D785BC9